MEFKLNRDGIRRILLGLITEELSTFRNKKIDVFRSATWSDDVSIDEDGLGFDSLGLLTVCGRVNQFFHLYEVGVEDYLLAHRTIGKWIEIVMRSLSIKSERLTFQTSGSSGVPKNCVQTLDWLQRDADAIAKMIAPSGRIVSLVPPQHIYGFIYTVLMPALHDLEFLDARTLAPGVLKAKLRATDTIVATPHLWRYALTTLGGLPKGITGVTSTAPMPPELRQLLVAENHVRLIEIYGSSETNGIGIRDHHAAEFTLFNWWAKGQHGASLLRESTSGEKVEIALMDHLQFSNERNFLPSGRLDKAVQIGGQNVFPLQIAARLCQIDCVENCIVRPFSPSGAPDQQRLKAFIILKSGSVEGEAESTIAAFIRQEFATHERPVALTFGSKLPVNDMGKSTDWA